MRYEKAVIRISMKFEIIAVLIIALVCKAAFGIHIEKMILDAINWRRSKVGNQNMTLDPELSKGCKEKAKQTWELFEKKLIDRLDFVNNSFGNFTESVCAFDNERPRECVRRWFYWRGSDELDQYKVFTAMIWNSSTTLGVGIAGRKPYKHRILVVRYNPRGNVDSELEKNVPERKIRAELPSKDPSTSLMNGSNPVLTSRVLLTLVILINYL